MPLAVDFQGGVSSAWSNVITFVPKLAAALLIILVGYLLARVVASVLNKVLERVGFDRAVERGGVKRALARSKSDPSDIIAKLGSSLLSGVSGGRVMAKGAGIAILVFGAFAALDQLQIAPRIVTGLWYAILAIVVGSAVVAIGGGGIKTMARYWERATTKVEERAPELAQQAQPSASASAADEGNGAAVYAEPATQEFAAERTGRLRRDR
jgi:hypothetical protein